ncbi:MAG: RagB/SusD family nutrient uptake outer membrane protein [Bacteroides sp.]
MKLKKIIVLLGLAFTSTALYTSCSLDLAPIDYYGSSNYWNTVTQVETFMNGIHTQLRSTSFDRQYVLGEARGGTSKSGTSSLNTSMNYDRIKENNLDKGNTGISNWNGLYGRIFACNLLIQNVEGKALQQNNPAEINYMLGQTYGIRALYYFTLYRTFGGVPLIDRVKVLDGQVSAQDLYTARSTPKQVMEFIKADITKSLECFGANEKMKGKKAYWSKAATTMLGAEVYLWAAKVTCQDQVPNAADLSKAKGYLTTILSDARFGLCDKFTDIFDVKNKGNKETIMAIRYADGESTNSASEFVYADPNGFFINTVYGRDGKLIPGDTLNLKGGGWQRNEYELGLWQSFQAEDGRRDATFLEYYNKDGSLKGTVLKKNLGMINSSNKRVFCGDEPVYRYADALLMMAEVANMEGGDVAKYINQVRARAYGSKWNEAAFGYNNADFKSNELAILFERDHEFVCEGKRWFDIVRMKDAKDGKPLAFSAEASYKEKQPVLKATEAHKLLWPLNIGLLNADTLLEQTPGYGE